MTGHDDAPAPPRVLACGLATLDVVQTVERLPAPDEKVVAHGLLVGAGGPATNAAVTCSVLGAHARLVTRVGDGAAARLVASDLAARGVEVLDLAAPGSSPAVSTVLVTAATGERAVVSVNATPTPAGSSAGALDAPTLLAGVDAVLVDGHHLDLAVPLARAARHLGIPVLLDGGSWKPGLETLLAHVDVAVLSADLRAPRPTTAPLDGVPTHGAPARHAPTHDELAAVAAVGPLAVAQSHGGSPVEVLVAGERATVPVPAVAVVDTLGAGDVLHGALLAWWARHRGGHRTGPTAPRLADVVAALRFATDVASRSCAAAGAHGWAEDAAALAAVRTAWAAGGQAARGS